MQKTAIQIKGLSKKYNISHQRSYLALRDSLEGLLKNPFAFLKRKNKGLPEKEVFWALKDICLEIKKGEVVGIIGRNGAGKTTFLKIISRITCPTQGEVNLRGRVGSLLEVGTGFHPELTGRENIYFNGSILGMRKKEIDKKFDQIVEFSGVEKFLDTPVKRFSSGMQVRLAFSVAAHLDPEILLVDEVLAVGDAQFQKKCLGKMKDVSQGGRTVLFVSHNMTAVRNLCKRTVLLESGRVAMDGPTELVTAAYLDQNLSLKGFVDEKEISGKLEGVVRRRNPTILLKRVTLLNNQGALCNAFRSDEPVVVSVVYECLEDIADLRVVVQVVDEDNNPVIISQNSDREEESELYLRKRGLYESFCLIPANLFGQRRFYISVHLLNLKIEHLILNKILSFDVNFQGYNLQHGEWAESILRPMLDWKTMLREARG